MSDRFDPRRVDYFYADLAARHPASPAPEGAPTSAEIVAAHALGRAA